MTQGPDDGAVVGVLSVHGAVSEHVDAVRRAGGQAVRVGSCDALDDVHALIIPGGESTTLRRAAGDELLAGVGRRVRAGLPVLGTCAGLIALADEVDGSGGPLIGGLDVTVHRNGYGRQVASFEAPIAYAQGWPGPPRPDGVFIRAPRITRIGPDVEVVATHAGEPVAVRQGERVGTAYHPELTADQRLHGWIVDRARAYHQRNHH